jgi:hypothetical protein
MSKATHPMTLASHHKGSEFSAALLGEPQILQNGHLLLTASTVMYEI